MNATRIKFCGFTRAEDLAEAVALGVDYVGFVFAARSKRRVTPDQARALRAIVPAGIGVVALVMDNPAEEVHAIIEALRPDVLQCHGGESAGFAVQFGLPYWKALAMGGDRSAALVQLADHPQAQAFLFDGHAAGEPGGSGQRFDWAALPAGLDRPFLLAGGLGANNVADAVAQARPWGVDVSSGIEDAPGIKSAHKMRAFVAALRGPSG